jgi:DNA replication and repair protein RecF
VPLTRLTLTDFRSYADMTIEPGPGFVVLTGDNGAGKTNILEAVSLLAPGRGLRGAALGEMARKDGAAGFSVSVRMGDVDLGTGTLATAPERRVVRINGATASATALSEWLSIVWLTPAQDRLFSDTPGARRRFFDRLVMALDPGHARHSARYEAAVRQRNRLLADDRPDHEWLAALENAMEEHGIEIERARTQTAIAITTAQASTRTDFPQFSLMIQSSGPISAKRLAANRGVHAAAGRTLLGPHTDDLLVKYRAKSQPAASSSTGEQKALLLGIVLAHADLVADARQERPILLLDEVAAHLDPSRRAALFDRLDAGGGQVWLTGTEAALFDAAPASATRYTVDDGRVTQSRPHAI